MPATGTFNWLGTQPGGYGNIANWISENGEIRVPTDLDNLVFGASPTAPEQPPIGPPSPPPPPPPSIDCVIPQAFVFSGIHLLESYTATVTTQDNTVVGTLELRNGAIAQIGYDNDLYVTQHLAFFGGTLNSTSNLGIVHITGTGQAGQPNLPATANLQPLTTPSLTLGSTLSLEGLGTATGGAGMAIYLGDYIIKNGADFVTWQFCSTEVGRAQPIAPPPAAPPPSTFSKTTFTVVPAAGALKAYTLLKVKVGGFINFTGNTTDDFRLDTAGLATISADVKVTMKDPYEVNGQSVIVQALGELRMHNASELKTANYIQVDGLFATIYGGIDSISTVTVDGSMEVTATGTLMLTKSVLPDVGGYGNLVLSKSLVIRGTLDMNMDGRIDIGPSGEESESLNCDRILSTSAVMFNAGSKLKVKATNLSSFVRLGRYWDIILAQATVPNAPPAPEDTHYSATRFDGNKQVRATHVGP